MEKGSSWCKGKNYPQNSNKKAEPVVGFRLLSCRSGRACAFEPLAVRAASDLPAVAVRPVSDLPAAAARPVSDLPAAAARPVSDLPAAAARPVSDLHAAAARPVSDLHAAAARPASDLHAAAARPASDLHAAAARPALTPSNRRRPTSRRWRPTCIRRRKPTESGCRPCGAPFRSRRDTSGSSQPSYCRCGRC